MYQFGGCCGFGQVWCGCDHILFNFSQKLVLKQEFTQAPFDLPNRKTGSYLCFLGYMALEQQLESLGQRWATVCKWVEEHSALLQEVQNKWQHFQEEMSQFSDWLAQKEEVLARMRLADLSEMSEIIEQVRNLKVSIVTS